MLRPSSIFSVLCAFGPFFLLKTVPEDVQNNKCSHYLVLKFVLISAVQSLGNYGLQVSSNSMLNERGHKVGEQKKNALEMVQMALQTKTKFSQGAEQADLPQNKINHNGLRIW
jgi:hypothetical protein